MSPSSPITSGLRLALVTAVVVAAVATTHALTRERIAEQERAAELRALAEVLPGARFEAVDPARILPASWPLLGAGTPPRVARAMVGGRPAGLAVHATAPDGYSGDIELLLGISAAGEITGVRVVSHRETPGLGDAIDHEVSDWIEQFEGRSLGRPPPERWTVQRDGGDFDQLTGATITARAVTHAVRRALEWYRLAGRNLLAPREPAARSQAPR